MRLQILVPHWDETPDEMAPLLDSLEIQQGIDFSEFGVIISFDGYENEEPSGYYSRSLPIDEWRKRYEFEIQTVYNEKCGVSAARNAALDAASADFVCFADADDMFMDVRGLHYIFQQIDAGFDVLPCTFMEETKDKDGNLIYVPHYRDQTFVHSKFFRRQYLTDNGLRFNPKLTIHEDSYFNILTQALCDPSDMSKIRHFEQPIYLWKWRDNSVCRHDPKYILKTFGNMIDSNDELIGEFVRRMRQDLAKQYVGFLVWDAYFTMNKPEWRDEMNKGYREKVERRFVRYFEKRREYWDALTDQEKMIISDGVRHRSIMEGMLPEDVSIFQWLEHIQKRY